MYKYGKCDPFIATRLERGYDLYVLCGLKDAEWEADPLREMPDEAERRQLHLRYKSELQQLKVPHLEVSGSVEQRRQQVTDYLLSPPATDAL